MATEGARERGIPWTPSMSLRSIRQQTTVWSDNSHHDDSRKWLPPTSSSQLNCYLRSLLKIEPPLRSGLETHMTIIQFRYKPVSNAAPGDTAYSLRFFDTIRSILCHDSAAFFENKTNIAGSKKEQRLIWSSLRSALANTRTAKRLTLDNIVWLSRSQSLARHCEPAVSQIGPVLPARVPNNTLQ